MITASIVTYHTKKSELYIVLDCVINSPITTIYIIDNSSNNYLKLLANYSDKIRYIYNGKNLGYGAGHNIAIKEAIDKGADFHLIINSDISFDPSTINYLLNFMNKNSDCGFVMPNVLSPDGGTQYLCKLLPSPIDLFMRRFIPLKKYLKKNNYKYELRFTGYNKEMNVPSLSGCFMFLRVDVLEKIGGFDERYFMYVEDLDLCRRIGEVSNTMFYPETFIYHVHAKESYKNKKLLMYHIASAIKYFNKWGWFFDKKRKKINTKTLEELGYTKILK